MKSMRQLADELYEKCHVEMAVHLQHMSKEDRAAAMKSVTHLAVDAFADGMDRGSLVVKGIYDKEIAELFRGGKK